MHSCIYMYLYVDTYKRARNGAELGTRNNSLEINYDLTNKKKHKERND